jgi:hypothetical protein
MVKKINTRFKKGDKVLILGFIKPPKKASPLSFHCDVRLTRKPVSRVITGVIEKVIYGKRPRAFVKFSKRILYYL